MCSSGKGAGFAIHRFRVDISFSLPMDRFVTGGPDFRVGCLPLCLIESSRETIHIKMCSSYRLKKLQFPLLLKKLLFSTNSLAKLSSDSLLLNSLLSDSLLSDSSISQSHSKL